MLVWCCLTARDVDPTIHRLHIDVSCLFIAGIGQVICYCVYYMQRYLCKPIAGVILGHCLRIRNCTFDNVWVWLTYKKSKKIVGENQVLHISNLVQALGNLSEALVVILVQSALPQSGCSTSFGFVFSVFNWSKECFRGWPYIRVTSR